MGKTKPERRSESFAKASKRMAKKLACIFLFLMHVFYEADSEAGCNCSLFNMGKTKPERSPESVAKATKRMAKELVCIIFFWRVLFWSRFWSWVQMFIIQYGEDKTRKKPRKCCKSYQKHGKKTSLYYFFLTRFVWAESAAGCTCSKLNRMPTKRRGKPTKSVAKATESMANNLMARFSWGQGTRRLFWNKITRCSFWFLCLPKKNGKTK